MISESYSDISFGICVNKRIENMGIATVDEDNYIFVYNNNNPNSFQKFESRIITDCFVIPNAWNILCMATQCFAIDTSLRCYLTDKMNQIYMKNQNGYNEIMKEFPQMNENGFVQLKRMIVVVPSQLRSCVSPSLENEWNSDIELCSESIDDFLH